MNRTELHRHTQAHLGQPVGNYGVHHRDELQRPSTSDGQRPHPSSHRAAQPARAQSTPTISEDFEAFINPQALLDNDEGDKSRHTIINQRASDGRVGSVAGANQGQPAQVVTPASNLCENNSEVPTFTQRHFIQPASHLAHNSPDHTVRFATPSGECHLPVNV